MRTVACKTCGSRIVWAVTGSGRAIPVDAEPAPDGNVELVERAILGAKVWGSNHEWPEGTPRYRSHFVSCPDAAQHRRKKAAQR